MIGVRTSSGASQSEVSSTSARDAKRLADRTATEVCATPTTTTVARAPQAGKAPIPGIRVPRLKDRSDGPGESTDFVNNYRAAGRDGTLCLRALRARPDSAEGASRDRTSAPGPTHARAPSSPRERQDASTRTEARPTASSRLLLYQPCCTYLALIYVEAASLRALNRRRSALPGFRNE
jgi:hypothetical protein